MMRRKEPVYSELDLDNADRETLLAAITKHPVLLERPIRLGAALSLIRSAMRGRERQYELRDLLKGDA